MNFQTYHFCSTVGSNCEARENWEPSNIMVSVVERRTQGHDPLLLSQRVCPCGFFLIAFGAALTDNYSVAHNEM